MHFQYLTNHFCGYFQLIQSKYSKLYMYKKSIHYFKVFHNKFEMENHLSWTTFLFTFRSANTHKQQFYIISSASHDTTENYFNIRKTFYHKRDDPSENNFQQQNSMFSSNYRTSKCKCWFCFQSKLLVRVGYFLK